MGNFDETLVFGPTFIHFLRRQWINFYLNICMLNTFGTGHWSRLLLLPIFRKFGPGLIFFNSLPASFVWWWHLQTVWNLIRPDKNSGLIWIQTVCYTDDNPEINFWKIRFWKKSSDDKIAWIVTQHARSLRGRAIRNMLHARQKVWLDLNPNCLTHRWYTRNIFFKYDFEK